MSQQSGLDSPPLGCLAAVVTFNYLCSRHTRNRICRSRVPQKVVTDLQFTFRMAQPRAQQNIPHGWGKDASGWKSATENLRHKLRIADHG